MNSIGTQTDSNDIQLLFISKIYLNILYGENVETWMAIQKQHIEAKNAIKLINSSENKLINKIIWTFNFYQTHTYIIKSS